LHAPTVKETWPRARWIPWVLALLLALSVAATYARALRFEFVSFDDDVYVTENEHVVPGITSDGILWAFSGEHGANWHPLTSLSHMLDCELAGLDPRWHHGVNVALHILATLLCFGLFASATGNSLGAAIVAALFGLHPLHVEAVAWVSERKELLAASFGFLSAWVFVTWTRRGGAWRYGLALLAFALGLLSKPMLVTWPFVLLLLDRWPLSRLNRASFARRTIEKLPFFALAGASAAITFAVQRTAGAMPAGHLVPFSQRTANAVVSYVRYLDLALRPGELAVLYPHPYGQGGRPWTGGEIAGAAVLLVVITLVATRRRYALMGWLWYLGTLVPVIGLVQVGSQGLADRYTYLPLIGPFVALTWAGLELANARPRLRVVLAGAACTCLVLLGLRAREQAEVWRDSTVLFENAVRVAPRSSVARTNLVHELAARGRYDEAFVHARKLVELAPGFARGHAALGTLHHRRGELEPAVAAYRAALERAPFETDTRYNLGAALRQLERWDEAAFVYERWLQLDRGAADAHFGLGAALEAAGRGEEALPSYREALRLRPEWRGSLEPRIGSLEQAARNASSSSTEALGFPESR